MATKTANVKSREKAFFTASRERFGYTNLLQAPRIEKVIISTGVGKIQDKNKLTLIQDRLAKITGQKAAPRGAKKSIATFKVRTGDIVGYQITLRGSRMYDFLDRLVNIALPRTRDFRGLPPKAFDDIGNYTIGIKEHTIFPETSDEEQRDIFGLAITVVTSAKDKEASRALLEHIGFPFQKAN
jgi:large subunit ribosomal protein L5